MTFFTSVPNPAYFLPVNEPTEVYLLFHISPRFPSYPCVRAFVSLGFTRRNCEDHYRCCVVGGGFQKGNRALPLLEERIPLHTVEEGVRFDFRCSV